MSNYIEVDGLRVDPCMWRSKVEEVERLQAQVVELVAVAVSVRDDLLLRSEIDSDGTRCVNLSASKWSSFCDVIDDNNSEAFILREQEEAVQASRRALSSCSEIPNSSGHASRQAVSVPEETLTAIHDTLRLVWSRELSADDGMQEIEILIPTKADESCTWEQDDE